MSRPPVVLVGMDCPTGLQAARVFSDRGVEVIGVAADRRHACARTRACSRVIPGGPGPYSVVASLLALAEERSDRPVLIPCTDLAVLGVARYREELSRHYRMSAPSLEVTELLLDKARFAEWAHSRGLPVPTTMVIRSREDARRVADTIGFPCALKPAVKTVAWKANAPGKAVVAASAAHLLRMYEEFRGWSDTFVAQEWIEGGDTDHYTCDCYLNANGEPLVTFTTRKLRQWPPTVGQGCLSVEHRDDYVTETALRVLREAGYHGQGYLEMKQDTRTGRHLIIEANIGRPTGRSAAAERAGVELLMTVYSDLAGLPIPSERTQTFRGTKWIHLRRDLQACVHGLLRGDLSIGEILRSWRGQLSFAVFSLRDPVPFLTDIANTVRGLRGRRGRALAERSAEDAVRSRVEPATTGGARSASVDADATLLDPTLPNPPRARVVDFELPGIFRVRTLDATPSDLAAVARDMGPPTPRSEGRPDVVVCFVDELRPTALRLMDGGSAAYGDEGVYFLDAGSDRPAAHVRPGEAWGTSLVVCRHGVRRVPSLAVSLDVAALRRGWAPLHASAWSVGGIGVIAAGWAHSGKTGALLAACQNGAHLIGDDRIFLSKDGSTLASAHRPLRVRDWHLAQLGLSEIDVGAVRRVLAKASPAFDRLDEQLAFGWGIRGAAAWRRPARKALARLRGTIGLDLPEHRLNGARRAVARARPGAIVLLEAHQSPAFETQWIDADTAVARLSAQVQAELMPALRAHLSFQYARPGTSWTDVHRVPEVVTDVLRSATKEVVAYAVRHPHPCSLARLHSVIVELVEIGSGATEPSRARVRSVAKPLTAPRKVAV